MRYRFEAQGGERYEIEGDPAYPTNITVFRNGEDMGKDFDGASVCESDILAELLQLSERAGAGLLTNKKATT